MILEGLEPGQAQRCGALVLAAADALDGAAQDLGLVGGGVEREGEQRAIPGIAEEHPEPDRLKLIAEGAEAIVDQEKLRDQRCAAEEVDIAIGE
jgi:hypothetical protein